MDRIQERLVLIVQENSVNDAGEDLQILRTTLCNMTRDELASVRHASVDVWRFLAAMATARRGLFRSQVGSVVRVIRADEGWRNSLETQVEPNVREQLQYAFVDPYECARDKGPAVCKTLYIRNGEQSQWQTLEEIVRCERFMGANAEFQALRMSILEGTSEDIDRQLEHADLVFAFLLGFARVKPLFRLRIVEVVNVLMQVPSWREAFCSSADTMGKIAGLHKDLQEAFRHTHIISAAEINVHVNEAPIKACWSDGKNAGPPSKHSAALAQRAEKMDRFVSLGISENSKCDSDTSANTLGRHRTELERIADSLRLFVESDEGQDLIRRTFEVYEFIVKMATRCRARSRGHGIVRAIAGATTAGGAGAVLVGGTMIASGGAATPAVGLVLAGGFATGAVGASMNLANALAAMGFDALEAKQVEKKINELSIRIASWDQYMNALLQAAENTKGTKVDGPPMIQEVAKVLAERGSSASSLYSIASALVRANVARTDALSAVAPAALGGVVRAGTATAANIALSFSALSLVLGLVDTINGGMQMRSGYSEAADRFDAHADKFCGLLRIMREIAHGTQVQLDLKGQLPWLVLIQVDSCKLPRPEYRIGDRTRKGILRNIQTRVYFEFQMRHRIRKSLGSLTMVQPGMMCSFGQAILMRIFPEDVMQVSLQGYDRRGIQSFLRGDPKMGARLTLDFSWEEEQHVILKSVNEDTELHLSYQLVRRNRGVSLFCEGPT